MKYGYARVSTDGQSVEAQVRQLTKAGCKKVFRETASGAKTDRSQLRKALDQLDASDVLMVTRLDRLARSTRDLLTQLSHRYASDSRNAAGNCGVPRSMSICGAKNRCPSRGHLVLTGSTPMCWRRCSRSAVRTVGRRKSRLSHRFSPGASQTALPTPCHVWCLNRSAPRNALISSHIFSSGGKVGPNDPTTRANHEALQVA